MTLDEFLNLFTQAIFLWVAGITLLGWLKYRDKTRLDVFLVFISLALIIIAQDLQKLLPGLDPLFSIILFLAFLTQPYFLLRVARYFRPVPTRVQQAALIGLLVTCVSIIFIEANPTIVAFLFFVYFTTVEAYASYLLIRGALTIPGITGKRLRLASIGSGLLALVFLIVLVLLVAALILKISELPASVNAIAMPLIQIIIIASGLCYYFGFAPPRWLIQAWQLRELYGFLHHTNGQYEAPTQAATFQQLSTAAMRAVGGTLAVVASWNINAKHLEIEIQGESPLRVENLETESTIVGKAWRQKRGMVASVPHELGPATAAWAEQIEAQTLLIVPVISSLRSWGLLIVALRYAPLFATDDIDMLTLLAEQSTIPLDHTLLITDLQSANQSLEQHVAKRTSQLVIINKELESEMAERKKIEEKIAYQAYLLQNVNDAVTGSDQDYILRYWNRGAERMYGWKAEEVIGKPGREIMRSEFFETNRETVLQILADSDRWEGEAVQYHKDGTQVITEISTITLRDSKGLITGYVSVSRDISERKQAEQELRASEERFRSTLDSMMEGGQIIDFDWCYRYVNETVIKQGHETRENLIGHTMMEVYPGIEKSEAFGLFQHSMQERVSHHMENEFIYPDGSKGWFELSIQPVHEGIFILSMDITERKRAEEKILHINEELEQRVVERTQRLEDTNLELENSRKEIQGILDSMATLNAKVALDGTLLFVNKIATQASGVTVEELMKTNFLEGQWWSFDPEVQMRVKNAFAEAVSGIKISYDEKIFVFGQILTISFSLTPMLGTDDLVEYVLAEARDISNLKQIEESLQTKTTQLEAANRELEAFSYSVSHDLRAPLRTIDGFSQAILEDYSDLLPEDGREHLDRVRKATQNMANLIDDLLNLSRVTRAPLRSETLDLSKFAIDIYNELQRTHPERNVKFNIEENLKANGDFHLIQAVLENFINNAWKFTSKRDDALIELGSKRENDELIFFIRDNGAGFDMAYSNKLFGAFQRLHSTAEFPGTGIGLATVQRIINRHGGRVWAESIIDQGTTFYFTLG